MVFSCSRASVSRLCLCRFLCCELLCAQHLQCSFEPFPSFLLDSRLSCSSQLSVCFVSETIRTGAMRVIHIPVKTEETQRLRIKFVLYSPICALDLKIKRANLKPFCPKKPTEFCFLPLHSNRIDCCLSPSCV